MVLRRSALREDNIFFFRELYADTRSDVSDISDSEILGSDSDIPTSNSYKQLLPSAIVITRDSAATSTDEEESSEPESSDDKRHDRWCKTDKKKTQAMSISLESQF